MSHTTEDRINSPRQPRILIYDIETSPLLSWNWGIYEQNAIRVKQDWYMLSFAYKWYGEEETHFVGLPDFKTFNYNKRNDKKLVGALADLMNEADVTVAHNGDAFDMKKLNARLIQHGYQPPKESKAVDTLKIARSKFKFTSNKLDDLGEYLNVGRKVKHEGIGLWFSCMEGDLDAWQRMKEYNLQDVDLLEKVYVKLRPWAKTAPNLAMISNRTDICPVCGADEGFFKNGYRYKNQNKYRAWRCKAKGCNVFGRQLVKREKEEMVR